MARDLDARRSSEYPTILNPISCPMDATIRNDSGRSRNQAGMHMFILRHEGIINEAALGPFTSATGGLKGVTNKLSSHEQG